MSEHFLPSHEFIKVSMHFENKYNTLPHFCFGFFGSSSDRCSAAEKRLPAGIRCVEFLVPSGVEQSGVHTGHKEPQDMDLVP